VERVILKTRPLNPKRLLQSVSFAAGPSSAPSDVKHTSRSADWGVGDGFLEGAGIGREMERSPLVALAIGFFRAFALLIVRVELLELDRYPPIEFLKVFF